MEKIWCLFSVENNYDQPQNNLVAWWLSKPSFETLGLAAGFGGFPGTTDEATLAVVKLWEGKEARDEHLTTYRLQEVAEGRTNGN